MIEHAFMLIFWNQMATERQGNNQQVVIGSYRGYGPFNTIDECENKMQTIMKYPATYIASCVPVMKFNVAAPPPVNRRDENIYEKLYSVDNPPPKKP